jgi:hypothetical protein
MCISDTYSLAERKTLGGVSMCSCGTIHVTVGGVTIRLEPEAFGEMVRMCQDAAERLLMSAEMTPGSSKLAN